MIQGVSFTAVMSTRPNRQRSSNHGGDDHFLIHGGDEHAAKRQRSSKSRRW
jgi:hypothetical protein